MNESIVLSTAGAGAVRMKFTEQGDMQFAVRSSADVADPPPGYATLSVDPATGAVAFRSNTGTTVQSSVASPFPDMTGQVAYFTDVSPPLGWLIADGRSYSRTRFARLFAKIGTRFGIGDGATTFNVPDIRGNLFGEDRVVATRNGMLWGCINAGTNDTLITSYNAMKIVSYLSPPYDFFAQEPLKSIALANPNMAWIWSTADTNPETKSVMGPLTNPVYLFYTYTNSSAAFAANMNSWRRICYDANCHRWLTRTTRAKYSSTVSRSELRP
jgi:hypothetical protein